MVEKKAPIPIKALKDNLLLVPLPQEKEEISKGGILLPGTAQKKMLPYNKGVVLAVGPSLNIEMDGGTSQIPDWIKPGMIVYYHQAAGWNVPFGDDVYVIVSWRQIECMVAPEYMEWKSKTTS